MANQRPDARQKQQCDIWRQLARFRLRIMPATQPSAPRGKKLSTWKTHSEAGTGAC
jgi:hypothetical protein